MKALVVTVTYNSSHILGDFLSKFYSSASDDVELVLVDSGSMDSLETKRLAAENGVRIELSNENLGYGGASNLGVREFSDNHDWLFFVNPDVNVTADQIRQLAEAGARAGLAVVAPRVTDMKGQLTVSWGRTVTPPWRHRDSGESEADGYLFTQTVSGCCMGVRTDVFNEAKGFDPDFFMFCEEMDLHRRIGDAGGTVAIYKGISVATPGGASSVGVSSRWRIVERSIAHTRYVRKHFSAVEGFIAFVFNLARVSLLPGFRPHVQSVRQFSRGLKGRAG